MNTTGSLVRLDWPWLLFDVWPPAGLDQCHEEMLHRRQPPPESGLLELR